MHPAQALFSRLALALLFMLAAGYSAAQQNAPYIVRADVDYRVISPQPTDPKGAIEVIDFFWYGCPYCYRLQPALERWIRAKPADVAVRRIPAILRESWAPHARIYYTLEALGEVERLHQQVYRGYHVEELHMSRPEVMSDWAVRQGIARERWDAAYHSPEVSRRVEEAARLTRAYGVTGTPTLVVDGRYLTSGNMAETLDGLIPILNGLVARVRAIR
jgi:thiol:disulfide interchange protein DsbA